MKKYTYFLLLFILAFASCSVDKNEMALLYNNQILNSYNDVTEALNKFFEATNNNITELKKSHQTAIKTTEIAIKNLELIEDVENADNFKENTLNYLNGALKILKEYGIKIIFFREDIDKQYNDQSIDSLNYFIQKSYDELDILTIQFDTAHARFAEQYHINLHLDTTLSE